MVSEVWVKRFGRNEETWSVGDKTFNVQRKKILCFTFFFYNLKVLVLNVSTLVFWCLIVLGLIFVGRTGQNIFALPFLLEKTKRKKKTSSFFFTYTLNVSKHNCMVCGVYEAFFRGLRGGWQNNFLGVTIIRPSWVLIWLSTPRKNILRRCDEIRCFRF